MFQLAVLLVVVAATAANPIYTGGLGYGGIGGVGTSSVSVSRTTDVVSPGIYSTGMIGTPGIVGGGIVTSGMYGTRSILAPLVEEKTSTTTLTRPVYEPLTEGSEVVEKRIVSPGLTETMVEEEVEVETPFGESEVITRETDIVSRGIAKRSAVAPMGGIGAGLGGHSSGMMGRGVGLGARGMMGGAGLGGMSASGRTDSVRPIPGGVQQSSAGGSVSSSPLGGTSVSSFQKNADRIL